LPQNRTLPKGNQRALQNPGEADLWIPRAVDTAVLGYKYSGYYTTINFIGNSITIIKI